MTARLFPVAWLFAFAAALMPFQAYQAHEFLVAFLLLAAMLTPVLLQTKIFLRGGWLLFSGFGFWVWALFSVPGSDAPYVSFIFFCFFSVMPMTFLLTQLLPDKDEFFKIVAYGLAAIFVALGVFSFIEYFFLPTWLHRGFVHWPLADPNSFAGLFSIAFFCSCGVMLGGRNRFESNAGLCLALLFLSVIFLTGSKGALWALIGTLAVFMIAARAHVRKHWRCCTILLGGAALIFLLLNIIPSPGQQSPLCVFTGSGPGQFMTRTALWRSSWHMVRDHFWHGTGIGTFFLYYPAYRGADYHTAGFTAHNDPLQFFAEMGVFAPLLFYVFIVAAVIRTAWIVYDIKPGDARRIAILAPFCALGAMVAHSHVNFHFYILPMLMLAGLLLGFWYRQIGDRPIRVLYPACLQMAASVVVIAAFIFAALQTSEILVGRAQARLEAGDVDGFMSDVNAAGRLSMNKNARALIMASGTLLGVLETQHLKFEEKNRMAMRAERLLDQAQRVNPRQVAIYYNRARIRKAAPHGGHSPEELLKEGLAIDPMHIPSRVMLADLLVRDGSGKEALEVLKAGVKWPNATPEYLQKTAFLALELRDMETHRAVMAKMLVAKARQIKTIEGSGALRESATLK